MTVAIRTDTSIVATVTQTSLVNGIKSAMINAGFTNPIDDYTSGTDRIVVYTKSVDTSKTYGILYYRVRVTTGLTVYAQIFSGWNATTHTGSNGGTEQTIATYSASGVISVAAFNGASEYNLIQLVQSSTVGALGLIVPDNKPTWWDLNLYPYGLAVGINPYNGGQMSSLNPYGNTGMLNNLNNSGLATANPVTNRRDVLTGVIFYSNSNSGIIGKTSDDLASVAASGLNRYDVIQPQNTSYQYTVFNNVAGGLALRTQ